MANPIITEEPFKIINGFQSNWNSSVLPIQYTILNDKFPSGLYGAENYYTEVNIYANGNLISTIRQIPDNNNETKIDVRKYIQTVLQFNQNGTNDINGWCEFYIDGTENYVDDFGNTQSNPIDNSGNIYYAALSALQFGNERGGNMYDYVLDSTKSDLSKFLTSFPVGLVTDSSNYFISCIVNEPEFSIIIDNYDINGVLQDSTENLILDEGLGLYRLNLELGFMTSDITTSIIYAEKNSIRLTEEYIINIDNECFDGFANAPENLQAIAFSTQQINLTWTPLTEFATIAIERKLSSASEFVQVATTNNNGFYNDNNLGSGLDFGTSYDYRIRIINPATSNYSNEATDQTYNVQYILGAGADMIKNPYNIDGQSLGTNGPDLEFSFSTWINFRDSSNVSDRLFLMNSDDANNNRFFLQVDQQNATEVFFTLAFGTLIGFQSFSGDGITTEYLTVNDEWRLITVTYQSGICSLYVDNQLFFDNLYIVQRMPTTFLSRFEIDAKNIVINEAFWIRDHALTIGQINTLFNQGRRSNFAFDATLGVEGFESYWYYRFNRPDIIPNGNNSGISNTNAIEESKGNADDLDLQNSVKIGTDDNWVDYIT